MDVGALLLAAAFFGTIFGVISLVIATTKNLRPFRYYFLGFLLGPIGVIIAASATPAQPTAPPGSRSVICPQCATRQNVENSVTTPECRQCKTWWNLVHERPLESRSAPPGWYQFGGRSRWWDGRRWHEWEDQADNRT
ncbi:MAG TPA: hypothetical protein VL179_09990 [Mycobacterium sp.]|nr:hypothetical protein [Mycobacterium sp.]